MENSVDSSQNFICGKGGVQKFVPKLTFMGFRYVEFTASQPLDFIGINVYQPFNQVPRMVETQIAPGQLKSNIGWCAMSVSCIGL